MGSRAELLDTLRKAASSLREVEERKMFGCEALFTRGSIFALVWKTGRIGVKLPDENRFGELARQKGAEPWRAGPMVMAHWLLVPPSLEDAKKLAPWVKEAHAMAAAGLGKLKVPKKIRGVNRGRRSPAPLERVHEGRRSLGEGRAAVNKKRGKRETTNMAGKKKGNESAIASAGEALASTPQAARTVAEEVVRAVTKVAKAAAGAAKAVATKGKKKAGAAKKKAGAAKKKAGAAAKKAGKAVKKVASKAKKTAKKK